MSGKEVYIHDSISDVDTNQWNNLVSQSEEGSVFQRTEWLYAIEEGLDSSPHHVVVEQDGNVRGVLPNFITEIDLPDAMSGLSEFTPTKVTSIQPGFGGPVTTSTDASLLGTLIDGVETGRESSDTYHQFNFLDQNYIGYSTYLKERGYSPLIKSCRFVVNLNRDFEKIKSDMSSQRRRNLRKAEGQDFRIVDEDIDQSSINDFYPKYVRVMDRVGSEPFPKPFFERLAGRLGKRIKILTLEVEGISAGKHLCLLDDEQESIHYYFSAVEEEDFGYYPSEILHMYAMKWGRDNGYRWYDFGETSADFSDGTFNYKKQFGGELVPTVTWRAGLSTPNWYLFQFGRRLYEKFLRS